ncbi:MAG: hypothetical protein Q8Q01_04370 [archaeon]|nr:hypothetical protein [archaeon]
MRFLEEYLKKFNPEKINRWGRRIFIGGLVTLAVLEPVKIVAYIDLSAIESANEQRKIEVIMPYLKEQHPGINSSYVTIHSGEETSSCPKYFERKELVIENQEPIRVRVNLPPMFMEEFFYKKSEVREFDYNFCLTGRTDLGGSERLHFEDLEILFCRYDIVPLEDKLEE